MSLPRVMPPTVGRGIAENLRYAVEQIDTEIRKILAEIERLTRQYEPSEKIEAEITALRDERERLRQETAQLQRQLERDRAALSKMKRDAAKFVDELQPR